MHHFIRLQELSNHDKHRVVTPVLVIPHRFTDYQVNFEEAGAEAVEWHSIADWPDWLQEPNPEIMRVKIRPSSLQLNMEVAGYVAPHVSFRDYKSDGRTFEADIQNDEVEPRFSTILILTEAFGVEPRDLLED